MGDGPRDVKPFGWVLATGAGFVVFFAMAILFGAFGQKMNTLRTPTFFFLLVALGLVAAGFLFGALRSQAKFKGKAYGGAVELGGPVVVLAMVVLLGYRFRPAEAAFALTLNVFAAGGGAAVEHGTLTAYYGNAHVTKPISDGQVILNEVPRELRGEQIRLLPLIEGYSGKELKAVIPTDDSPVNLYVEKTADSVTISGIVLTRKGAVVRDATVVVADGLARGSTDQFGNFRLTLPLKDGSETHLRVYVGDDLRYNGLVTLSSQVALNIPVE
jgi:hypothetical protein